MWRQFGAASISMILFLTTAGIARAQGYVTQDPGNLTPGNLSFQNLGPAGPVTEPPQPRQATPRPGPYRPSGPAANGARPGTGAAGSGSSHPSGLGGNLSGSGR